MLKEEQNPLMQGPEPHWRAEENIDNASLKFSMALTTAADIFLSGDAAQAFLGGKIDAEGNIAEALVLNDVITVFLDLLPFAEAPF